MWCMDIFTAVLSGVGWPPGSSTVGVALKSPMMMADPIMAIRE